MSRQKLEAELKILIVEALMLEEQKAEDIDSDAPLFGEGLGLDSIDALELGMAVSKRYGLELDASASSASPDDAVRNAFRSVAALAAYVDENTDKNTDADDKKSD